MLKQLGKQRHLYLPYFIYYLRNRCATVFYILCGDHIDQSPYGGFISVTISEGFKYNLNSITGLMTEEIMDCYPLHQNYLWGKELQAQPSHHWKHKLMNKSNCKKAINLVDKYINLLKVHHKHIKDLGHLCLIIANIHSCFKYNKDDRMKSGFYCYYHSDEVESESQYCLNLQDDTILCKEYTFNKSSHEETSCLHGDYDLDYPDSMDKFFD